jgi:hypothetical protein
MPGINKHLLRILWSVVTLALLGALPLQAAGPLFTPQQRFGLGFAPYVYEGLTRVPQDLGTYQVAPFQVGWYSDWSLHVTPPQPADATIEFVQLLDVQTWPPRWDEVRAAAQANPRSLWLIGNEPECPNQGNRTPDRYATIYHQAYTQIKDADPLATIAIGGVVEPTPLRLRWIEAAMAAYQRDYSTTMPVEVWNIHMQILKEGPGNEGAGVPVGIPAEGARAYTLQDCANVQLFKTLVIEFRTWMAAHGQRDKPLIISEMGVLQPSFYLVEDHGEPEEQRKEMGDRLIEQYMMQTFVWLLTAQDATLGCPTDGNRLVQRWLWFSLNGGFYDGVSRDRFNGSLVDYRDHSLTRFGRALVSFQEMTPRLHLPLVLRNARG